MQSIKRNGYTDPYQPLTNIIHPFFPSTFIFIFFKHRSIFQEGRSRNALPSPHPLSPFPSHLDPPHGTDTCESIRVPSADDFLQPLLRHRSIMVEAKRSKDIVCYCLQS